MGSFLSVTCRDGVASENLLPLVNALENEISHRVFSSSVAALNRGERVTLSPMLAEALRLCLDVCEKTDGAFSPFVLPLTTLWNFDGEMHLPTEEELSAALSAVKESRIVWDGNTALLEGGIDLGAVGKGMAAGLLAEELAAKGESGLVAVGGSLGAVGNKNGAPWRIGVRDPFSASQSDQIGMLALENAFVSTSGSYEKTFTENGVSYHHILNAQTGMPAQTGLVSVTVAASDGLLSDLLSTAVFAVGMEKGAALCAAYGAHVLFVTENGTIYADEGMLALFEAADGKEVVPL